MIKPVLTICLLLNALVHTSGAEQGGPIATFVQVNLVGLPVVHDQQKWHFDPDIALRRRRQFVALHGDKGEKLIERLGLGIDGYASERLQKQRQRDEGHLGGLNYYLP